MENEIRYTYAAAKASLLSSIFHFSFFIFPLFPRIKIFTKNLPVLNGIFLTYFLIMGFVKIFDLDIMGKIDIISIIGKVGKAGRNCQARRICRFRKLGVLPSFKDAPFRLRNIDYVD